jgi:hypothetical protein
MPIAGKQKSTAIAIMVVKSSLEIHILHFRQLSVRLVASGHSFIADRWMRSAFLIEGW